MTINTYGTLKTAVANWQNRSDLTTYIPDFVQLASQRMFYGGAAPFDSVPIRHPSMQAQDSGSVAGGYISFPDNFLEAIRFAASDGTNTWELEYQPLTSFEDAAPTTASWYTYRDNAIYTGVSASTSYTLDYYEQFVLSGDSDTNWILTNTPNVYLYASMLESALFIGDDAAIAKWFGLYKSAVFGLTRGVNKRGPSLAVRAR